VAASVARCDTCLDASQKIAGYPLVALTRRALRPGRRPSSARGALGGAGSEFGALKPSLKRIKSTSVLAGGPRAPSLAPARHRRPLRSHPLPRMASFGSDVSLDALAGGAPHGRAQVRMRRPLSRTQDGGAQHGRNMLRHLQARAP